MKDLIGKINHNRPLFYFNMVALFFLLNGIAAGLNVQFDLTCDGTNSLSESTEKVLSKIDDRILVEAYISRDLPGQANVMLDPVIARLKQIERIGGDKIQYRLINPDTEEKRKQAQKRGVQGVRIAEAKVAESTVRLGYFGVYVQIGDRSELISLLGNRQGGGGVIDDFEYQFLRALKKISRKEESSDLAFVEGPGLFRNVPPNQQTGFSKDSMYIFRYLMEQDGEKPGSIPLDLPVPDKYHTLIVSGLPRLEEKEIYHLDQFLMRGGNLILMLKGFDFQLQRQDPRLARFNIPMSGGAFASVPEEDVKKMNDWLGPYGVTVNGEILYEPEQATPTFDLEGKYFNAFRNPVWGFYTRQRKNIKSDHPSLRDLEAIIFPWFSGLDLKEALQPKVKYSVLVQSSTGAISRKTGNFDPRSLYVMRPEPNESRTGRHIPLAIMAVGKFKSAFSADSLPTGVRADRFRAEQTGDDISRMIVMGTPYLVSDVLLQRQENAEIFRYNQTFLMNLLEAVSGDEDLIAARSRIPQMRLLESTGETFQTLFKWFHILLLPLGLAVFGTLRLIRRNQRMGITSVNNGEATGAGAD